MASIGSIPLDIDGTLGSGIALVLTSPPEESFEYKYNGNVIRYEEGNSYIVCCLKDSLTQQETLEIGRESIQVTLDMLSITGKVDLATKKVDEEYVAWWRDEKETILSLVDTTTLSLKSGPMELVVKDKDGKIIPSNPPQQKHHLGFRFYRFSQVSDDLFGSFRNMYLAFEHLLSSKCPKEKEQEIQWLTRALSQVSEELNLTATLPKNTVKPIDYIIDTIYKNARLPLFHAKDGKTFFTPANELIEQKTTLEALSLLSKIVTEMANKWFNSRRMGSWFNEKIFEEQFPTMFENAHCTYSELKLTNEEFNNVDINHEFFKLNPQFTLDFSSDFKEKRQPNIKGRTLLKKETHHRAKSVMVRNNNTVLLGLVTDAVIDFSGFDWFEFTVLLKTHQGGQPKSLFQR